MRDGVSWPLQRPIFTATVLKIEPGIFLVLEAVATAPKPGAAEPAPAQDPAAVASASMQW